MHGRKRKRARWDDVRAICSSPFFLEKDERIVENCAKFKRMHAFKIHIYQIKYNARDFYL